MAVSIKTAREIELMRQSARLLEDVFASLEAAVRPGISTKEIDRLGEKLIREHGCEPNFCIIMDTQRQSVFLSMMKWYMGFHTMLIFYRRAISSAWTQA